MRDFFTRLRLLGPALAGLVLVTAPLAAEREPTKQGRVTGTVTDTRGEPLADTKVTITTAANKRVRVVVNTGKDGRFSTFLQDATVAYHFLFEKPGYASVEKDKKVPIWNPNNLAASAELQSETYSVLDVTLTEAPPAATIAR